MYITESHRHPRRARVLVLMGLEPSSGAALRPLGVLGLEGTEVEVSWLPYESGSDHWRKRLLSSDVTSPATVERWFVEADGISWDIVEVTPPEAEDLAMAVEKTVDLLLAAATEEEAS